MASKFFLFFLLITYTQSSPVEKTLELRNTRVDDALYRIPEGQIEVLHYDISLKLGKDLFVTRNFEGIVGIQFKNLKETNEIKIHANTMNFSRVQLVDENSNQVNLANEEFVINNVNEFLTLITTTTLTANSTYILLIEYATQLRTGLDGFYQSTYKASNGDTVYLGTTQFQTTSARKAFPCFDEPFYKATFDIAIRYPKNYNTGGEYNAIGNTKGTTQIDPNDADFKITTFATTPRMSTYLIAFIVSDFTCTAGEEIHDGIRHSICSRSDTESIRDLAVSAGPKIVRALENYTGISFDVHGIGKIDQAAIPDFSAGAMENWGLATYREVYLLWDPEESSNRYKQYLITIISHELGHFWFGDLVTCHWWSDTFLNEGFATYFEYFAANEVYPEMEFNRQFVLDELHPVLITDANVDSAPLSSPAASPNEVSGRFGTVSYSKGGSVIRMASHFLGLDNFKKGLTLYLNTYKFQPVTPDNLWSSLNTYKPDGLPDTVPVLMKEWTEESGFPLITVGVQGRNVILTQRRFSSTGANITTTWWVPISYTTASDNHKFQDTSARFWLEPSSASQTISNALQNDNDWIILNNQQSGYFRVEYSDELWDRIHTALNQPGFGGIDPLNRAQIIDDLYNYARYGYRSYSFLLKMYEFLKRDTSYFSWYPAFTAFNAILPRLGDGEIRTAFIEHLRDLVAVVYSTLSDTKDDEQIYTLTKVLVLPWACRLGIQDCGHKAADAFAKYRDQNITPNKNLKSTYYCNGIRHSTNLTRDWNFMWNQYLNDDLATERSTFISALACTTDAETLTEFLRKTITANSGIRSQDSLSVFQAVYTQNYEGIDVALDFFIANFDDIAQNYQSTNSISSIFSNLATRLTRQDQIEKLRNFVQNKDLGSYNGIAQNALATGQTTLNTAQQFETEMNLYFRPSEEGNTADAISASFATFFISFVVFSYQNFC